MKIEITMQEAMDYLYDILNQDNNIEVDDNLTSIKDDNTGKMFKPNELSIIMMTKEKEEDV